MIQTIGTTVLGGITWTVFLDVSGRQFVLISGAKVYGHWVAVDEAFDDTLAVAG